MLSAALCKSCGNWIHGKCTKVKRVNSTLAIDLKCRKCKMHKNVEDHKEKLHDDVETVTEFSYQGDRIDSEGGCVADVKSRTRLGWVKFGECQDLLCGKKFPLKIKGIVYKSCVKSAILHGSETWSLGQNEIGILQGTERAIVRNMCGMKLMDKKSTKDLMWMLDLNETLDQLAKASSVRWYGHVLRKDENNFLRRALDLRVKGIDQRKVGLNLSGANNRSRWRLGANTISSMMK